MAKTLKINEQKRQHRERAQPLAREKLGLLEKHQDYVKRARDFHSKEDRLNKLREKASGRNKDEFYFGMIKSRTKKGVHIQSRDAPVLPIDLVKVLKSQDAGYIRTQRAIEESKVKRLQEELNILIDTEDSLPVPTSEEVDDWDSFDEPVASTSKKPQRSHIVFTDNLELVKNPDTTKLLSKKNKGKGKAAVVSLTPEELATRASEAAAHRSSLETLLAARQSRLSSLTLALRELEMQRLLMGKGAKKALVAKKGKKEVDEMDWELEGDEKRKKGVEDMSLGEGVGTGARVWKWKQERKR